MDFIAWVWNIKIPLRYIVLVFLIPWLALALFWIMPNGVRLKYKDEGYLFTYSKDFSPVGDRQKQIYKAITDAYDMVLKDNCAKCGPHKEKILKYLNGEYCFESFSLS